MAHAIKNAWGWKKEPVGENYGMGITVDGDLTREFLPRESVILRCGLHGMIPVEGYPALGDIKVSYAPMFDRPESFTVPKFFMFTYEDSEGIWLELPDGTDYVRVPCPEEYGPHLALHQREALRLLALHNQKKRETIEACKKTATVKTL